VALQIEDLALQIGKDLALQIGRERELAREPRLPAFVDRKMIPLQSLNEISCDLGNNAPSRVKRQLSSGALQ
jgi:hypothetical protein